MRKHPILQIQLFPFLSFFLFTGYKQVSQFLLPSETVVIIRFRRDCPRSPAFFRNYSPQKKAFCRDFPHDSASCRETRQEAESRGQTRQKPIHHACIVVSEGSRKSWTVSEEANYDGQYRQEA